MLGQIISKLLVLCELEALSVLNVFCIKYKKQSSGEDGSRTHVLLILKELSTCLGCNLRITQNLTVPLLQFGLLKTNLLLI